MAWENAGAVVDNAFSRELSIGADGFGDLTKQANHMREAQQEAKTNEEKEEG